MTSAAPNLLQIVGGAVVDSLDRPTSLLVARRTAPPQFAGMWEFPGGKVEQGETCEDALLRELREELGIRAELGSEIPGPLPEGWSLNDRAVMRVWFARAVLGEAAPLQDHDEVRWVPLDPADELQELPWIPADRPIVAALLSRVAACDSGDPGDSGDRGYVVTDPEGDVVANP